jgi:predicted DNA-binding antitoxin AbrB/MazE fold protein
MVSANSEAGYRTFDGVLRDVCEQSSRYVDQDRKAIRRLTMLPVIKTFEKELLGQGLSVLKPLERVDLAEGVALPDEAQRVVKNRSGSILSASTILKSDFFSNLQKMSLPE